MNAVNSGADYVVLGAGLAGLSVARQLGSRALVLERAERPGGLVRSECYGGYWFDHAVHLLYFADGATEEFVRTLPGVHLAPCPPLAFVETEAGVARYPVQSHLGTLDRDVVARCVQDLQAACETPAAGPPDNYEAFLLETFGRALCDLFFFPYNRKLWKRPLAELAPSGFVWNIARPRIEDVLAGAANTSGKLQAYNARGFYPRPPPAAAVRGIEVLTRALAAGVSGLRLQTRVTRVDPIRRLVHAEEHGRPLVFGYDQGVCATLPLPVLIELCSNAPADLLADCRQLENNRVRSVWVCVEGERPVESGHWRYFVDEALSFHRLVYPHAFDPLNAPGHGFGVLAEVTERAETAKTPERALIDAVVRDLSLAGVITAGHRVCDAGVLDLEPAYAVFGSGQQPIVQRAMSFLIENRIWPVGRYARWEYSSMAQAIRDGLSLGAELERAPAGSLA